MENQEKTAWYKPRKLTDSELKKNFWSSLLIGVIFPPALLLALIFGLNIFDRKKDSMNRYLRWFLMSVCFLIFVAGALILASLSI